jgi:clan AA aspartic protease (TIGR02281 family)
MPSHIFTTITVNGVKMRAMLDTGAPGTVLSRAAAEKAGIDLTGPDAKADGVAHGIGIKGRNRWVVRLKTFDIGGETIANTPISVIDQDLDSEDAIIGMDFFLSHHLLVSRSQSRIYITYNGGPIFRPAPNMPRARSIRSNRIWAAQPRSKRQRMPPNWRGAVRRGWRSGTMPGRSKTCPPPSRKIPMRPITGATGPGLCRQPPARPVAQGLGAGDEIAAR